MTFQTRTISLLTDTQKQLAIAAVNNAPTGQNLEVLIREVTKKRTESQNALMFASAIKDIAEQVWVEGRQYDKDTWHRYLKKYFLPDETSEPYIHELVKDPATYKKFATSPDGEQECVGSTTQLTKYGFSQYLEQIYAFGASNGVLFTTKER
jgi:hypothetical protein